MLLLEQDNTRKGQVNELGNDLSKPKREFKARDNKEYEVETIIDSTVYGQETNGQIPGLYHLVL